MYDERQPLKDGYEYTGKGLEIRLIDPVACPSCGRFRWGQRGHVPCVQHRGHPEWTCACDQAIYREAGAFVTALTCR